MIGKIAVSAANFAIDKPYSYFIPQDMELQPGMRVMLPFGRGNRRCEGIVLSVEPGEAQGLKAVEQRLDAQPVLSHTMLQLAAFLRERYFCTFYDAVRAMLPGGLWFRSRNTYVLTEDTSWRESNVRQADGLTLLNQLAQFGGQAAEATLLETLGDEERLRKALDYLLRKGWISAQVSVARRSHDKTEQIATLARGAEETMAYATQRPKSAGMQRAVLELLCAIGSAPVKEICYFTGAKPVTLRRLADMGYVNLEEKPALRCREIPPTPVSEPLVLDEAQQAAYDGLARQMDGEKPGVALLHGVTGSGKTSVYLKLIQKTLEAGKSAVFLVPEIALTPQLLGLLAAYFGDQVAVLHSSLPMGERYDQWKRIRSGEARVVVGTRSAVFAPCPHLGLIILDEEQEHSYKSENTPRYSTKEVAIWRGAKERSLVVLGSATPTIETMFRAETGDYSLYRLERRYNGQTLPRVEIVDMGEELRDGNETSLSYPLQAALEETINAGQQAILFLNRRGNSRALVCVDCRESPECPRCSARLTYHSANERLMCHYCGYSQSVPQECPHCGGRLKRVGTGTQKVQQELEARFPGIRVERMDADTVTAANTHEQILSRFQEEKIPVLLGTQMVAKGLNLPEVTLVGVLDGDMSLYSSSYRAAETTFNMLTQVVGRAGRGNVPGRAIIQTMTPRHPVIRLAASQDYSGFYALEQQLRRVQGFPPFGDNTEITFTGQEEARVLRAAAAFRDSLRSILRQETRETYTLLGPAPCPVPKINFYFRYRLTLRCRMDKPLRQVIAHLLRQSAQDKQNRGVNVFADVNGLD
ncbi:MAG TPA: primosomal protein N' [Candidatus Faecousia intestinigallinarum]|nr:primosomal protein N' [Candidatus Faecousia intestinigallinarum]